jgi:hypothetical protein
MSQERTKAALHYVIKAAAGRPLGAVRLNKIILFADVWSYEESGEPVSGARFIKRRQGPVIDWFYNLIDELKLAHAIAETIIEGPENDYRQYDSLGEPDMSGFSFRGLKLLDRAIDEICGQPANITSDKTHNHIWKIAEDGDYLPIAGYFKTEVLPVTDADIKKMTELLASHPE